MHCSLQLAGVQKALAAREQSLAGAAKEADARQHQVRCATLVSSLYVDDHEQHDEEVAKLKHALKQLQDAQQQAQVCVCVCARTCVCVRACMHTHGMHACTCMFCIWSRAYICHTIMVYTVIVHILVFVSKRSDNHSRSYGTIFMRLF